MYYFKLCPKGDYSQIIEDLGKDVLPEEYGGTNGKMQDHIGNFNFKIHWESEIVRNKWIKISFI